MHFDCCRVSIAPLPGSTTYWQRSYGLTLNVSWINDAPWIIALGRWNAHLAANVRASPTRSAKFAHRAIYSGPSSTKRRRRNTTSRRPSTWATKVHFIDGQHVAPASVHVSPRGRRCASLLLVSCHYRRHRCVTSGPPLPHCSAVLTTAAVPFLIIAAATVAQILYRRRRPSPHFFRRPVTSAPPVL